MGIWDRFINIILKRKDNTSELNIKWDDIDYSSIFDSVYKFKLQDLVRTLRNKEDLPVGTESKIIAMTRRKDDNWAAKYKIHTPGRYSKWEFFEDELELILKVDYEKSN